MRGPDENVYTMAATPVLRLIRQYGIDPRQVGFLALGAKSSTDNSAGAVIVKGMVSQALRTAGRARLAHHAATVRALPGAPAFAGQVAASAATLAVRTSSINRSLTERMSLSAW